MPGRRSFPGTGHRYDLIVVGAGIAGSETAFAAAAGGCDTLLVTTSLDTVYNLFGTGAELDPSPGTLMAELAPRLADERGYVASWDLHLAAKQRLEETPGLHLLQSNVSGLLSDGGRVQGVETWEGVERRGQRVALCVGSFLEAQLTIGAVTERAGRLGEMSYDDLYHDLTGHGLAFTTLVTRVEPAPGELPYEVRCRVLVGGERHGDPHALPAPAGLYAAGLCAAGYLRYEEAAAAGRALALRLVAGS